MVAGDLPRQRAVERRDHECRSSGQHVAKCEREDAGGLGAWMSGNDQCAARRVSDPHNRRAPLGQGRQRRVLIGDTIEGQSPGLDLGLRLLRREVEHEVRPFGRELEFCEVLQACRGRGVIGRQPVDQALQCHQHRNRRGQGGGALTPFDRNLRIRAPRNALGKMNVPAAQPHWIEAKNELHVPHQYMARRHAGRPRQLSHCGH